MPSYVTLTPRDAVTVTSAPGGGIDIQTVDGRLQFKIDSTNLGAAGCRFIVNFAHFRVGNDIHVVDAETEWQKWIRLPNNAVEAKLASWKVVERAGFQPQTYFDENMFLELDTYYDLERAFGSAVLTNNQLALNIWIMTV